MEKTNQTESEVGIDPAIAAIFPAHFLWGAATSAYQIEGATHEDGRGPSIWDQYAATPGKTFQGETGDIATDHYHRVREDVALMAQLHLNAYRFSIAWPRILPQGTGAINERGLDFYERLVNTLLEYRITPVVTLYHWDLPLALHERGGWLNRDTALAFADYVEIVVKRLGDRVRWWTTLNEPWCSAYLGYGTGHNAPGMTDMQSAFIAGHHLLLAHGLALPRLRAHARQAQVGITLNPIPIYAVDDQPETQQAAERADTLTNRWFLDPLFRRRYPDGIFAQANVAPPSIEADDMAVIAAPIDFLGVNTYSRQLVRAPGEKQSGSTPGYEIVDRIAGPIYTEVGWEVFPQALTDVLVRIYQDYSPRSLIVTENGAAFADQWDGSDQIKDSLRVQYLRDYIQAMGQAIGRGVPVQGYFVWSLLDNFEWGHGYSKRFGIVYVDYPTQRRIVKESGRWYAQFLGSLHRFQR